MDQIILTGLTMKIESYSYIDALHAILTSKDWLACSKELMAGMAAMSFRFTVNRRLTVESSTAYNWMAEHFVAADLLGIKTSQHAGYSFQPTFPLYQKQAVRIIKQSIRQGTGVLIWKDSFVVVSGYDDEQGVLLYCNGSSEQLQSLKYEDFGRNESPYWYYQLYEGKIQLDPYEVYKESLMQAISKWETHDVLLPQNEYACGRAAYDAIVEALASGDYEYDGAFETFRCYGAAKRDSAQYLSSLQHVWPLCSRVSELYAHVADLFDVIVSRTNEDGKVLIPLFKSAEQYEAMAIEELRKLFTEDVHNRFDDLGLR